MSCLRVVSIAIGLLSVSARGFSQTQPTGVSARPASSDYSVSQATRVATFAASVVPATEVRHAFVADVSGSYLVFEVACYPGPAGVANLSPQSFVLRMAGAKSDYVRPVDGLTVASVIREKNTPKRLADADLHVGGQVGVASETDPYTGRRVHDVYYGAETGAGVGNRPSDYPPYPAGGSSTDWMVLERQLQLRELPTGNFTAPVAGYLYFPVSALGKKSKSAYELEYSGNDGAQVNLTLRSKAKS